MVHDILREMWAALGEFETGGLQAELTLGSLVDRLQYAAKQIGMSGWLELLAEYPRDHEVSLAEARSFVERSRLRLSSMPAEAVRWRNRG